jgi:hypothetical protein
MNDPLLIAQITGLLYQALELARGAGLGLSVVRQQLDVVAAGGGDPLPPGPRYESDGTTAPTPDYGLVRIQLVDQFVAQLKEKDPASYEKVKHLIPTWYACTPGLRKLSPRLPDGSDWNPAYWICQTEVSWAPFWGTTFWDPDAWPVNKYVINKGALLPYQAFVRQAGEHVPDAIAMAKEFDTPQKIVAELKLRVDEWLRRESIPRPDGVDFSPVPPRGR